MNKRVVVNIEKAMARFEHRWSGCEIRNPTVQSKLRIAISVSAAQSNATALELRMPHDMPLLPSQIAHDELLDHRAAENAREELDRNLPNREHTFSQSQIIHQQSVSHQHRQHPRSASDPTTTTSAVALAKHTHSQPGDSSTITREPIPSEPAAAARRRRPGDPATDSAAGDTTIAQANTTHSVVSTTDTDTQAAPEAASAAPETAPESAVS